MWQWLKRLLWQEKMGMWQDTHQKGFAWGRSRRGYVNDAPYNALPYPHGTKEAEQWMAGYRAGRGEDGQP